MAIPAEFIAVCALKSESPFSSLLVCCYMPVIGRLEREVRRLPCIKFSVRVQRFTSFPVSYLELPKHAICVIDIYRRFIHAMVTKLDICVWCSTYGIIALEIRDGKCMLRCLILRPLQNFFCGNLQLYIIFAAFLFFIIRVSTFTFCLAEIRSF